MLDLVLAGMTPLIVMVTEPWAYILIEETEKLFPLAGQLPSDPEHVQLTEVFLEVEKLSETPLNL
jgi:hypothetical protein